MREGFGGRIVGGALFTELKHKALGYLRDPDKLRDLIQRGSRKADAAGRTGPLKSVWQTLMTLIRLLRAYAKGEYRDVPSQSLILIVAGVLYFVMPIDVIPDFVIGIGYLDDAAVLAWVVSAVRTVLDDFARWESIRAGSRVVDV
jgi:uncharacterized membrane protein YkvA (DUF1232 family)